MNPPEEKKAGDDYETPHPEGITSLCYSCTEYETCNVKTGTCTSCDQYSEGDRMRTQLTEKVVQGHDSTPVNQIIRCKSD